MKRRTSPLLNTERLDKDEYRENSMEVSTVGIERSQPLS
jgi:hypothetical protein